MTAGSSKNNPVTGYSGSIYSTWIADADAAIVLTGADNMSTNPGGFMRKQVCSLLDAIAYAIDTALGGGAPGPYLRQDGSTPLTGAWDAGDYDVKGVKTLAVGSTSVPADGIGLANAKYLRGRNTPTGTYYTLAGVDASNVARFGDASLALRLYGTTYRLDLGSDAQGDIYYRNGLGNLERLPVAVGWLYSGGPGYDPAYTTPTAAAVGAVPTTRTVSTTAPLAGGGALSGDLSLTFAVASQARGDLLVRDASAWTRLAIGSGTTKVLRSDGTDPYWGTLAAADVGAAASSLTVTGTAPVTVNSDNAAHALTGNLTVAVVDASASVSGVVNTTTQGFSGAKTFDDVYIRGSAGKGLWSDHELYLISSADAIEFYAGLNICARMYPTQAVIIGSSDIPSLTGPALVLDNTTYLKGVNAAFSAVYTIMGVDGSNVLQYGDITTSSTFSATTFTFTNTTRSLAWAASKLGPADVAGAAYDLRVAGQTRTTGTDASGGALVLEAGLGTGNGTVAAVTVRGPSIVGASGTTQQTLYDVARFGCDYSALYYSIGTEGCRLYSDGGFTVGTTQALGGVGIGLCKSKAYKVRNNADAAWITVAGHDTNDLISVGVGSEGVRVTGLQLVRNAQSGSYTILRSDTLVCYTGTGGHTFTLPAAATRQAGQFLVIQAGSSLVVGSTLGIAPAGSDTINAYAGTRYLDAPDDVAILTSDGVSNWTLSIQSGPGTGPGFFGDAIDGDTTISTAVSMTQDRFYGTLTITSAGSLNTNGWRLYVRTLLKIDSGGVLHCNGNDAATLTSGAATSSSGTLGNGGRGVDGTTGIGSAPTGVNDAGGAGGGAGGSGGAGAGGGAGTATAVGTTKGSIHSYHAVLYGETSGRGGAVYFNGGTGGASGAGQVGVASGGGGGGGAGVMICQARTVLNNGTISTNGGKGGNATAGNAGGGGGGGGGYLGLIYGALFGTGTITASGGTGGAKNGTGVAGSSGSAGNVVKLQIGG